jgi:hypothetical protein
MQDIYCHPTLRLFTTSRPYIQVVPPFPVLVYEHTNQTKRKALQFHIKVTGISKEDITEVGVIPIMNGAEKIELIHAGGIAEPTLEPGKYIFRNLQLNKPKDRGVNRCFLRFYVRTRREYRTVPFSRIHSFSFFGFSLFISSHSIDRQEYDLCRVQTTSNQS